MAVHFDSAAASTDNSPGSSVTWSHTNSSTATALWVCGGSPQINSATYNGVSMTELHDISADTRWKSFYLPSPATGGNTVQVNFDNTDNFVGISVGVNGSATDATVVGAAGTAISTGESMSKNITNEGSNSLNVDGLIMLSTWTTGSESATGSNQTNRISSEPFANDAAAHGSTQTTTTPVGYETSWSWTGSVGIRYSRMEFKVGAAAPAAGEAPYTPVVMCY